LCHHPSIINLNLNKPSSFIIYESAEFERPKHVLAKINSSRLSTGSPVEQPHERAKFCCHHGDKHAEKEEEEEKE
jgi:hypothetical protein